MVKATPSMSKSNLDREQSFAGRPSNEIFPRGNAGARTEKYDVEFFPDPPAGVNGMRVYC